MHSVLLILKIIGIVLAVLLGLLLLVLCLVLFVPLRYRLEGERRPESGEIVVKGRISWFLSLISVCFGYEKEGFFQIRLLGIAWKSGKKKEQKEEEKPKEEQKADRAAEAEESMAEALPCEESVPEVPSDEKSERTAKISPEEMRKGLAEDLVEGLAVPPREEPSEGLMENSREEQAGVENIFGKFRNILCGLWEKLKGIPVLLQRQKEKLHRVIQSIQRLGERLDKWREFLGSEEVKETFRLLWRQTKGLFRHVLPRKVRIQGRFGFGDPALTGQVTGLMSMLPAFYQEGISVTPDFTKACLEGEFLIKGRIRAANLILLGLKIWFNKDFQKAYRRFKEM